jgi:hypothetical protein
MFVTFFGVIARTLQDVLGDAWTPEMDQAWQFLQAEIDEMVAQAS